MKKVSFRVRNFEKEQFLTYNIDDEATLDEEVLDFLEDEEPKGLVPVIYDEEEESDTFSYDITEKICLSELSNQEINAEMVLKVMRGLVLSFIDMGEYRVPLSYLVLNRNYIYVNSDYEVEFICIPLEEMQEEVDLNAFLRNFVASLRFESSENGDYVARMLTYINNTAIFNLRNMVTLIEDLMDVCGVAIPEDTSADIYVDYQEVDEDGIIEEQQSVSAEEADWEAIIEEAEAAEEDTEELTAEEIAMEAETVEKEEAVAEEVVEEDAAAEETVTEAETVEEDAEETTAEEITMEEESVEKEEAVVEEVVVAEDMTEEEAAATEETVMKEETVEEEEAAEEAAVTEGVIEDKAVVEETTEEEVAETEELVEEDIVDKKVSDETTEKPEKVVPKNKDEVIEEVKEVQKNPKKPRLKTKEIPVTSVVIEDELDVFLAEKEKEDYKVKHEESGLKIKKDIKVSRASIVKSNQEELKEAEEAVETPVEATEEPVQSQGTPKKVADIPKVNPYLIRVNTEERIMITKQNFKVGKASMGVDYTIKGNGAVSRVHAIITNKDDIYYIKDNKSTNHTVVNGKVLEDGDLEALVDDCKIVLGDEEFVFKLG